MDLLKRLRVGASRVPAKSAAAEFTRLLTVQALPGDGWKTLDQRAWITGRGGSPEPWAMNASRAKLVTTWRSFEQSLPSRWLWVQLVPLASEEDGRAAFLTLPDSFLANSRAQVEVVSGREVECPPVIGHPVGWAYEEHVAGEPGTGHSLMMAFAVGSAIVALAASGSAQAWGWDEVHHLATTQARLL